MEKLTAKQQKVLGLFADNSIRSITEISQHSGVSIQNICKWMNEEQFKLQLQLLIEGFRDMELCNVWKALVDKCMKGDIPAMKLFFELGGKYQQSGDAIGVQIIDDIPCGGQAWA